MCGTHSKAASQPSCNSLRNMKFTLAELLVVIAIIAVLASILLPALGKARERAFSISCMNKEKQIASATFLYVQDQDDFFPGDWNYLAGYLPYKAYTVSESASAPVIDDIKNKAESIRCPADNPFGKNENTFWYFTSYGMNYYLSRDPAKPKISRVILPSQKIWVMDLEYRMFSASISYGLPLVFGGNRHSGGWNALFVDGHVKWGMTSDFNITSSDISSIYPVQ